MAEISIGWLGWSEAQALSSDVNAIIVGYEGRMNMFETVGWVERQKPVPAKDLPKMTPGLFKAMFGG